MLCFYKDGLAQRRERGGGVHMLGENWEKKFLLVPSALKLSSRNDSPVTRIPSQTPTPSF